MTTAFMSEPLTSLNMLGDAIHNVKTTGKQFVARAFTAYAMSLVTNAALKAMIQALRDDDKEKDWLVKYLSSVADNIFGDIFGMVPVLNTVLNIIQGYDSTRMDTQAITTVINAVKSGFNYLTKLVSGENVTYEETKKAILKITNGVSQGLGIPVYNVARDVWSAVDKIYNRITTDEWNIPFSTIDFKLSMGEKFDWMPGVDKSIDYEQYVQDYINGKDRNISKYKEYIEDKDNVKQVTTAIGRLYRAGKIDRLSANNALRVLCGKDAKDADSYLKRQDKAMQEGE